MMPTVSPLSNGLRKVIGAALILALITPTPAWALRPTMQGSTTVGLEQALHSPVAVASLQATLSGVHQQSFSAFEHEFVERSVDLIIVSAGSRELAVLYQDHYAMLKGVLCRDDVPVVCVADPEGKRVGNGGAVGHALLTVAKDRWKELQQAYPHLRGRSIHQLRIVVVQAGGFGTRYTAGASDASKTRMPTGAVIPQRTDQAPVTNEQSLTMMDAALVGAYKFTQRLRANGQSGLVILNGDALLVTEPHIMNGISIITNPESIDEAVDKLGVVVVDPSTRKIVAFEEKPSEDRLKELKRSYPECEHLRLTDRAIRQIDTNTGSCIVTDSSSQKYRRFFEAVIAIAELMWSRIQEAKPVYEIDMSNDFFIPLTTGQTSYLNRRVFGKAGFSRTLAREEIIALMGGSDVSLGDGTVVSAATWGDRLWFYQAVYQQVRQNFPGLYAPKQDPARTAFLDAGDDRTWYRLMTGDHVLSHVFGVRSRVNSVLMDGAQVPSTAVLSNSVVGPSVVIGERAVLHGSDLFKGSRVGAGSVVYNVYGPVVMGQDQFLVQTPVQGVGSAIIYKGRDERLTETVARTKLFGQPALPLLEHWRTEDGQAVLDLLSIHERGEALGRRSMKELAIWPVTRRGQIDMALVAWMANGGSAPTAYLQARKVSYEESTRRVDFDQLRINQVLGPERRFRRAIAAGQIPQNPAPMLEELYRADRALVRAQKQLGADQVKRNAARFGRAEGVLRTKPNGLMELRAAVPPALSGNQKLETLYRRLSDALSERVLRREPPVAYGVTIARLKRGASSVADRQVQQAVEAIDALARRQAPFVLHLKGVSITFKGEVVIHGYVYTPTLYQMQRALVGQLPFALPIIADRRAGEWQSVFLNLKIAQMIHPPTGAEFHALERAIEPLLEEDFGDFVVNEVSLVADGPHDESRPVQAFTLGVSSTVGLEEDQASSAPEGSQPGRRDAVDLRGVPELERLQYRPGAPVMLITIPVGQPVRDALAKLPVSVYLSTDAAEPIMRDRARYRQIIQAVNPEILFTFVNDPMGADILDARVTPRLRWIVHMGAGFNNVLNETSRPILTRRKIGVTYIGPSKVAGRTVAPAPVTAAPESPLRRTVAEFNEALLLAGWFRLTERVTVESGPGDGPRLLPALEERLRTHPDVVAHLLWAQFLRQVKQLDAASQLVAEGKFRGAGNGRVGSVVSHQLAPDNETGPRGTIALLGDPGVVRLLRAIATAHGLEVLQPKHAAIARYLILAPGSRGFRVAPLEKRDAAGAPYRWIVDARTLSLSSSIPRQERAAAVEALLAEPLTGKTLAVAGATGSIGSYLTQIMQPFGMRVVTLQRGEDLEAFWRAGDLFAFPVRLSEAGPDQTAGMLSPDRLGFLTPGRKVISNIARGQLVSDEIAWGKAIRQHPDLVYVSDVARDEFAVEQPLRQLGPQGLLTAHTSSNGRQVLNPLGVRDRMALTVVQDNLTAVLRGLAGDRTAQPDNLLFLPTGQSGAEETSAPTRSTRGIYARVPSEALAIPMLQGLGPFLDRQAGAVRSAVTSGEWVLLPGSTKYPTGYAEAGGVTLTFVGAETVGEMRHFRMFNLGTPRLGQLNQLFAAAFDEDGKQRAPRGVEAKAWQTLRAAAETLTERYGIQHVQIVKQPLLRPPLDLAEAATTLVEKALSVSQRDAGALTQLRAGRRTVWTAAEAERVLGVLEGTLQNGDIRAINDHLVRGLNDPFGTPMSYEVRSVWVKASSAIDHLQIQEPSAATRRPVRTPAPVSTPPDKGARPGEEPTGRAGGLEESQLEKQLRSVIEAHQEGGRVTVADQGRKIQRQLQQLDPRERNFVLGWGELSDVKIMNTTDFLECQASPDRAQTWFQRLTYRLGEARQAFARAPRIPGTEIRVLQGRYRDEPVSPDLLLRLGTAMMTIQMVGLPTGGDSFVTEHTTVVWLDPLRSPDHPPVPPSLGKLGWTTAHPPDVVPIKDDLLHGVEQQLVTSAAIRRLRTTYPVRVLMQGGAFDLSQELYDNLLVMEGWLAELEYTVAWGNSQPQVEWEKMRDSVQEPISNVETALRTYEGLSEQEVAWTATGRQVVQRLRARSDGVRAVLAARAGASGLEEARDLINAGRRGEALAVLGEQLQRDPQSRPVRLLRAELLLALHRAREALVDLTWVPLRGVPDDLDALLLQAKAQTLLGRAPRAQQAARRTIDQLLQRDPRNAEAYVVSSRLWRLAGDPGLAFQEAKKACALAPRSFEAWRAYAKALFSRGQRVEALEATGQMEKLDPHHPDTFLLRATLVVSLGRGDGMAELRQAVALRPDDLRVAWHAARFLRSHQRLAEVQSLLAPVLSSPPEDPVDGQLYASVLHASGRTVDAIQTLAHYCVLYPTDPGARQLLLNWRQEQTVIQAPPLPREAASAIEAVGEEGETAAPGVPDSAGGLEELVQAWEGVPVTTVDRERGRQLRVIFSRPETFPAIPLVAKAGWDVTVVVSGRLEQMGVRRLLSGLRVPWGRCAVVVKGDPDAYARGLVDAMHPPTTAYWVGAQPGDWLTGLRTLLGDWQTPVVYNTALDNALERTDQFLRTYL